MLLAETPESDPHYEILKKVERQTFRAARIVNNLLEFARKRQLLVFDRFLARIAVVFGGAAILKGGLVRELHRRRGHVQHVEFFRQRLHHDAMLLQVAREERFA